MELFVAKLDIDQPLKLSLDFGVLRVFCYWHNNMIFFVKNVSLCDIANSR